MSEPAPRVLLVDDDPSVLKALSRLLRAAGLEVETFPSAREILARVRDDVAGCVVLDLNLPEIDGLGLQRLLASTATVLPVIFLTGHGDVPTSVQAMQAGAVDFLVKPCDEAQLLAAVERAFARDRRRRAARRERLELEARFATLTPREREVCERVALGRLNKQIAFELGTSEKTVKVHRGRVMQKLGLDSVAELVRLVDRWLSDPAS